MDHNQLPNQQDFLYPVIDGSEPRDVMSTDEQLALYNSPMHYNRYPSSQQQQPLQNVQAFPQAAAPQMDSYNTPANNWMQASYSTTGAALDLAGLMPGTVYATDDAHSSISSADNQSIYSKHANKSYASSTSSSPEYSYNSKHGSYNDNSAASSPSSAYSPKKPEIDADGKVKRSRMGCLTCRHRKKRCCESRPRCHECARLGLKCTWPAPGSEHRNKPKHVRMNDGMHYDPFYGNIKILRGIVEHRVGAI